MCIFLTMMHVMWTKFSLLLGKAMLKYLSAPVIL